MALDDPLTEEGASYHGRHAVIEVTLRWDGLIAEGTNPDDVRAMLARGVEARAWRLPKSPTVAGSRVVETYGRKQSLRMDPARLAALAASLSPAERDACAVPKGDGDA